MTRENKLALVVGFGLILLVGILVSDHLSAASRKESATFARSPDPARVAPRPSDDLIAARPVTTAPTVEVPVVEREPEPSLVEEAAAPTPSNEAPRATDPVQVPGFRPVGETPTRITMGGSNGGLTTEPSAAARRTHHVRPGETLTSIAEQYYGTRDAAEALAQHNHIDDPDLVRVGHRLTIPDPGVLGLAAATPSVEPPATPKAAEARPAAVRGAKTEPDYIEYTIKDGDRLGEIAKRFLGSAKAVDRIIKANPRTLRDPNRIRVGDKLRIPRT